MKILHIAKFNNDKANGIRTVVPCHVTEQAHYEEVLFQNILPYRVENLKYQVPFDKSNWPFNINDLQGHAFVPEVVVFHGFYHFEMVLLAKKLTKVGIPYIIVPHGSLTKSAQRRKWLKKTIGNIAFFNNFVRSAKAVQFLSKDECKSSKIKNRQFVGTNGIRLPKEYRKGFNAHQINFVYIGRIDIFIKGLDLLFEAVINKKELLIKNNCKFSLYGPISRDWHYLQNVIKKEGLQDLIILNREVYGEAKERVLLENDVFIQTSRTEAMPMGLLEALSYGLPCLITQGARLGAFIEEYDAGWVAETTTQSLYERIIATIEERECFQEKSNGARCLIAQEFAWEKIAKETIENYKSVLNV